MKGSRSGEEMETEIFDSDASQDNLKSKSANSNNNKKQKKQKGKKHLDSESGKDDIDDMVSGITKGVKKMDVNKAKNKNKNKSKNKQSATFSDEDDVDTNELIKSKAKKSKKNVFDALLMDDGDDDDDNNNAEPVQSEEDEEPIKKNTNKNNAAGGKKSKKNKRKDKHDDDEDLDQVLAELQAEYAGEIIPATVGAAAGAPVPSKKKNKLVAAAAAAGSIEEDNNNNNSDDDAEDNDGGSTVKSAAQKKREKKERQKREAALAKQRGPVPTQESVDVPIGKTTTAKTTANVNETEVPEIVNEEANNDAENVGDDAKGKAANKKKNKKDKKDAEAAEAEAKKDTKKKGMSAAMVAAMQERLKQVKEEEERLQREEEERMRQEDERERQRLEALRMEVEKKEKRKQKEAERKARLKAEGKLLTKKQKEERARAQAMLDALKAQGLEIPDPAERRATRPGTRIRPNKKKPTDKKEESANGGEQQQDANSLSDAAASVGEEKPAVEPKIKESWDASDTEEEANGEDEETQTTSTNSDEQHQQHNHHHHHHHHHHKGAAGKRDNGDEAGAESADSADEDGDDSVSDADTDSDSAESDKEQGIKFNPNDPEAVRLRAEQRISNRQNDAEKKRTLDNLRAAVVCVLGHVDTGKTKILDKLRRTHVQDSEAGGITQQIGATNVPIDAIKEQSKVVREAIEFEYKLPGLLIIDTPGHESFSNLRNRGSSLCDIAILVVDIMHGLEPQTIESITMLKKKKCPFIVALNKIDRLYDWKVMARRDVRDVLKEQQANTQLEFNTRVKDVILQFAEQGLNAAMFYENPDPKTYISLVPTSAITGEGMGNLLFMIVEFCQRMLPKRLMYSEELQATVLEVKAIPGLGTTIDAILINGRLREGETMILAGTDGPIVTQIRSLLMPQPLKELRVKNAYVEYKEIKAAQGVKIAAKDLEKAIAGINLLIAHKPDEVEICKEEIVRELKSALSHIKLAQTGVYVQASTLGSLEALLEFLRTSKIPYSAIRIGPVVKRDVMKASTMLEHEAQYATILAFDVKVEREAQEMADALGVKIFQADIIYHLFDKFTAYREELRQKKREEFKSIAVFPCKLKILPQFVFNSRDPIIMGVIVENGIVKVGTPICVPSKEFVDIGIVTSIESNHKQLDSARKGLEVCIKIDPIPGESPKMFGRHFDADDMLVSKISRQSIDACKDYFRDDLIKADWSLMVELKKLFEIM